jgi:hypothetical protein
MDPDSMGSVDLDLDSDYRCGSGEPKIAHKQEENKSSFPNLDF